MKLPSIYTAATLAVVNPVGDTTPCGADPPWAQNVRARSAKSRLSVFAPVTSVLSPAPAADDGVPRRSESMIQLSPANAESKSDPAATPGTVESLTASHRIPPVVKVQSRNTSNLEFLTMTAELS